MYGCFVFIMLWLILGLITAVFFAVFHIFVKKAAHETKPEYLALSLFLFNCVIGFPFLFILKSQIVVSKFSMIGLLVLGVEIAFTDYIYIKSLKIGSISKTVPLLSITPLFTVIIGFLWLKEVPSFYGLMGILLLIAGVYVLNITEFKVKKIFAPFGAIFKNKGSRLMFYLAVIYGFGSILDKFVINNSSPITRVFLYSYFSFAAMALFLLFRDGKKIFEVTRSTIKNNFWTILIMSVLHFMFIIPQMIGISLTVTAYVIALKRTSALFAVILAYFIFKERKDFKNILIGTLLLVMGAVLLVV